MGRPSVFPMGTTIYNPEQCWNGYTLFPATNLGAVLIDMNGKVVHLWKDLQGFPNKMLEGGIVFGHRGERDRAISYQDRIDLVQCDWNGNIQWIFDKTEFIDDPNTAPQWMARMHHDFQREGNSVGYYIPGQSARPDGGKTLILCHRDVKKPEISPQNLIDDYLIEVDWNGNIIWEWLCSEHFQEFHFDETAKNAIYRNPNTHPGGPDGIGQGDWFHINTASYLGANKWYDTGDKRFHPENIIMDSREANIMFIIDHQSGNVVWHIGPDFTAAKELQLIGSIIGMHNAHMIPKGLPGDGNILVFDNGGWAGYGLPGAMSKTGMKTVRRDYSRVLEINPITLELIWELSPQTLGLNMPQLTHYFYSPLVSNAQRLPNGNTLITEGTMGRILEVTHTCEIVWEYISPYFKADTQNNLVYRAYRYPYDWIPQLNKPEEVPIQPVDNTLFWLPGAADSSYENVSVSVDGTWGYGKGGVFSLDKT